MEVDTHLSWADYVDDPMDIDEGFMMVKPKKRKPIIADKSMDNKIINCNVCNISFCFDVKQQTDFKLKNWCDPKVCENCRRNRKKRKGK